VPQDVVDARVSEGAGIKCDGLVDPVVKPEARKKFGHRDISLLAIHAHDERADANPTAAGVVNEAQTGNRKLSQIAITLTPVRQLLGAG
jgi:hypothetical protein